MNNKAKIALKWTLFLVGVLIIGLVIAGSPMNKGKPQCRDNLDNDGDGFIDYPDDPGCESRKDRDEFNEPVIVCGNNQRESVEVCDGIDLDGESCTTQGFDGGNLFCANDCNSFVTNNCFFNTCLDTDGGNVLSVAGTTFGELNGISYNNSDNCIDADNILEYYCSEDLEISEQQNCGTDSSFNICNNGDVWSNSTNYFCTDGACGVDVSFILTESCSFGCTNGECDSVTESCTDSDNGFDVTIKGNVSGFKDGNYYVNTDSCLDSLNVIEWYCSGTNAINLSNYCPSGSNTTSLTCINGRCA